MVKQNQILVKFFKKKSELPRQKVGKNINIIYSKKVFDSFCLLQNRNNKDSSMLSDYSTSSEEKMFSFIKK